MIFPIFKHELQQQWRSKTIKLLLPIVIILLGLIIRIHWNQQLIFSENQSSWQQLNDKLWEAQPDRHPHRVSHYGTLVFRTISPLNFIDTGINPYVGNALFLEAHRQNSSNFKQFSLSNSYLQIGYPSAATIILVLWPLVLIALAFNSVSQERETGLLKQLISLNINKKDLFLGKWLAYFFISFLFLLLVFMVAIVFIYMWQLDNGHNIDLWVRTATLFLLYSIYISIWITIILFFSFLSKTSSQSLYRLIICWFFLTVFFPKTIPLLAEYSYPLPERVAFDVLLEKEIAKIGDAHKSDDPYFNEFKKSKLKQYGVTNVDELPINWKGLVMKEGERITSEVFSKQYEIIEQKINKQLFLYNAFSILSPYMIVNSLSNSIANSNIKNFYEFEKQAENYRYELIQELNELHIEKIDYKNDSSAVRISSSNWQDLKPFSFNELDYKESISTTVSLIVWVFLWCFMLIVIVSRIILNSREGYDVL
jgi:ABC-2 type transport system permease protein